MGWHYTKLLTLGKLFFSPDSSTAQQSINLYLKYKKPLS
ncbi:hypothetical protein PTUN_a0928 [Pseudoalteromonas tunicata]|nr:hypothetical protein PTUN_a0928 [Pseudoalteromonas tunicata]